MECQPTPPLDEMDPQALGDDNDADPPSSSSSSSSSSFSTSCANNNASMTEAEVEAEVDTDKEPTEEERPPHILYLWHLCHMYGILMKVWQQLQGDCVVDGMNAPSIDTSSCRKRKHTPSLTSVRDYDGLTKNMEQIVESINGLVGVTKQSHQTQQMNILHRRCKELEDTVQALDNSCMELELNMLEETCPRKKKVYQKMLEKRKK